MPPAAEATTTRPTTPRAPSPVSREGEEDDEDEERDAVDACLDALCVIETEGVETEGIEPALDGDAPSPERIAPPASSSTPAREETKTVEIKIEAPSPAPEIVSTADDDAARADAETPFAASRAAKRSRPDPNDVLQDGGEPAADVEMGDDA